jgi:hypothetical protein
MKIKNNVTVIELSYEEAQSALSEYQSDMLWDIYRSLTDGDRGRSQFLLNLLRNGENSDWFQDLVEKQAVPWIGTPDDKLGLIELIVNYPFVFGIGDAIEALESKELMTEDALEVYFDNVKLNSKTILANI